MADQQYLSTDPNAGEPTGSKAYLSTDPSAGQESSSTPLQAAKEFGLGLISAPVADAVHLGQLFYRVPGIKQVSDLAQRAEYGNVVPADALFEGATNRLRPATTAATLGRAAGQVGEFFLLPTGIGGLGARAATQGIGGAALSAAQGGSPADVAITGALSAVAPGTEAAVQRYAPALRESAQKLVTQALGPTKERFKAMAEKVAPTFLARDVSGWTGLSRSQLLTQASAKARAAGQAVDDVLQTAGPQTVSVQPVIDALEDAKQAFTVTRPLTAKELADPTVADAARQVGPGQYVTDVILDQRPVGQLSRLQATLTQLGSAATVDQIVAVRRAWDQVVAQAGGYAQRAAGAIGVPLKDQSEAWAKRQATTAIRQALASNVPDLAAVNREYSFWKTLQDVVSQTQKRTQPQTGGLARTALTGAGMVAGASSGDSVHDRIEDAILGGAIGNQLMKAFTSPRWKFISAKLRNELADAITSGTVPRATAVANRILAATATPLLTTMGGQ